MSFERREGEVTLPFNPADCDGPNVAFIGHVHSPWSKGNAPRNLRQARERGGTFYLQLKPDYVPALQGLRVGAAIIVMYWMDQSRRDLVVQHPRHADGPRGTFTLRSPARPNPIALATVRITELDTKTGRVGIDAIDCFDGTPLLDIKPWLPTIDTPPEDH